MAKVIPFSPPSEVPEIETMDREALISYRQELLEQLAQLDAREPRNMQSPAYEEWGDAHEELEDLLDDIQDRLDLLEEESAPSC